MKKIEKLLCLLRFGILFKPLKSFSQAKPAEPNTPGSCPAAVQIYNAAKIRMDWFLLFLLRISIQLFFIPK